MRLHRLLPAMAFTCASLLPTLSAFAQTAPVPSTPPAAQAPAPQAPPAPVDAVKNIGGKWVETAAIEEKMTGKQRIRFELDADNFLPGAEARPKLILFCVGGKLKLGDFRPNVRLAPPNRMSFGGRPRLKVMVRVDSVHYNKNWDWEKGDSLARDKDTV